MDDSVTLPQSAAKAIIEPQKDDRLLENFELFLTQLTHVADAMGLCLDRARAVLTNYEPVSTNVPKHLRPLIENIELIQTQIIAATIDMRADKLRYAHEATGADGRGTWRQVLKVLLRIVGEVMMQLSQLPAIPHSESARHNIARRYTQSHVMPVLASFTEDLKVLTVVWPTLMLVTMDPNALTEDEGKAMLAATYTHPFWYSYDSYMTRFRNLFDLLKLSILNSYKKSGFFSKNFHRGINGLQAIFTTNKTLSRQADEQGKNNANIHFVKELWNLAETGLPEKFVSWMKPGIKVREYFRLTLTPEMKALRPEFRQLHSVRVLHLYHSTSGGVKIPKEWHTHSPYSSHDLEAQQLVATALMDVEKTDAAEEEQRREQRDKLKKHLKDEYEREKSKGFDQTKETRRVSAKIARIEKEEEEERKSAEKELKKIDKEERRRSKAIVKEMVKASSKDGERPARTSSANDLSQGSRSSSGSFEHTDASTSLEHSQEGRTSPDLENLFKTMPLEPFLEPTEVENYRLSISGEDLVDITDAEDPALRSAAPDAPEVAVEKSDSGRKSKEKRRSSEKKSEKRDKKASKRRSAENTTAADEEENAEQHKADLLATTSSSSGATTPSISSATTSTTSSSTAATGTAESSASAHPTATSGVAEVATADAEEELDIINDNQNSACDPTSHHHHHHHIPRIRSKKHKHNTESTSSESIPADESLAEDDNKKATTAHKTSATAAPPSSTTSTKTTEDEPDEHDVVLHFHGGGFVSGSPSSHESYLRTWANNTNAVVFSVDYSLGPEFRYPIAFNECFFFYHWLTSPNNPLGFRPRKVILSGDSAGGNLAMAVALKAAEAGIRKPDGLVVAYPALNATKAATPSRVVFGNDVLVPYYFLEVCLDSYVDQKSRPSEDYCLSPLFAPDELIAQLPEDLVFMAAGYDPLLDDTVAFLRRLDKLNKPYLYEVYECPHGFWNFDAVLLEAERAMYRAGKMIRCMIDPAYAKIWQLTEEKLVRAQAQAGNALQFSIARALPPYPARTPATFKPLSDSEVIYQLSHSSRPRKAKQPANGTPAAGAPPPTAATASSSTPLEPTTKKITEYQV